MPTYTAQALVLHRRSLGEHDRILTLFTKEHGKISAVAKGSQRTTSRLVGATEPFTHVRLLLATARSLDIITQCEIVNAYPALRTDIERLSRAAYICDLLDAFSHPHDASSSEAVFELTCAALFLLTQPSAWLDSIIYAYDIRLLEILGYAPALEYCAHCGEPLQEPPFGFSPAAGGALCARCRHTSLDVFPLPADTLIALQTLRTAPPEALLHYLPPKTVVSSIERALRSFIRFRAERPLHTVEFLDSLRIARN
ncbi:DNA replication and repair protein RecO [Chthonomonas calidirosea]|uniref:DNA repair protein RecO n=1 Tax=Chthonomonas calidirosea (strain DSM 23976 / ICMP 18418 / T49) TaxID=1303518 RepID=S0ESR6_CHTCT|nr:DNA repair protein RecO [Chthonomonas calidirosea]CCW34386.1 DNA replication and repair protein RecO [Chthonomonas calidirosea T49]CEK14923.1 DNA replication and repair protein RecO [Chthonomonas calidirosea]